MKKSIQQQQHLPATTRRTLTGVALGLLWLVSAPGLAGAQYAFTQIDAPDAVATYADGNGTQRLVGEFEDQEGNTHGFVWRKGEFTQFDVPGAEGFTSINGINARGERSGIYFAGDRPYGYFWSHGVVTTLDPPDSTFSVASFLNAKGQVVGCSRDAGGTRHGFIWRNGVFTPSTCPVRDPQGPGPAGSTTGGRSWERTTMKTGTCTGSC